MGTYRDFSGALHVPVPAVLPLHPEWKRSGRRCLIWAGTQCPDHCRRDIASLHGWSASARRSPTRAAPQFRLSEALWIVPNRTLAAHRAAPLRADRIDNVPMGSPVAPVL